MRFRRLLTVWPFAVWLSVLVLAGCSSLPRTSYTASDAASSTGAGSQGIARLCGRAGIDLSQVKCELSPRSAQLSRIVSGGADGRYGAGVLNGWSAAGTRPQFSAVSGVSTGALIAPFAFLGPAYDATLREV